MVPDGSSRQRLPSRPYKGARDFYPDEMRLFRWVFDRMSSAVELLGYEPYNGPLLEPTEIYAAKSGEELVRDQIYRFTDRGGRDVALRPEMTPTLARMVAARLQQLVMPVRWYSVGNMFRYERPQRGRTREHWQLNVDVLGLPGVEGDVEILGAARAVMMSLGASPEDCVGYVNNRRFTSGYLTEVVGVPETATAGVISEIDRKAKIPAEVFRANLADLGLSAGQIGSLEEMFTWGVGDLAEKFAERLEGAAELVELFEALKRRGIDDFFALNLGVVRGLAYYTGTVFEMFDRDPANPRALYGGGRYDDLTSLFAPAGVTGIGFGLGDVTITDFLVTHGLLPELGPQIRVLVAVLDEGLRDACHGIADRLREDGIPTEVYGFSGKALKKQFRHADRKGIPYLVLFGAEEAAKGCATVKDLRSGDQQTVGLKNLSAVFTKI